MSSRPTPKRGILRISLQLAAIALSLGLSSQAQTFTVLHTFSGPDGEFPQAGLSIDAAGSLFGTTPFGGLPSSDCPTGCGVIFRLARQGSAWILTPLHKFRGPSDGSLPIARPVFGPGGRLYGTTNSGGADFCEGPGCGTLYSIRPPATVCVTALCSWTESIVYSFGGVESICTGGEDSARGHGMSPQRPPGTISLGSCPGPGDLTFDRAGNAYGTVACCYGSVYQITPDGTPTALYYFAGGQDGGGPQSGVIFDQAGNLFGTTAGGGQFGGGTVYELSPSGSGWTEKILYSFRGGSDGSGPVGGLIMDAAGNLYGTASFGGDRWGGTVFELSPSGSDWTFHLIYSLQYTGTFDWTFYGPSGSLAMDASGSLYGTAVLAGAFDDGSVFKLTPNHDGSWTYTSLHDFTGRSDGGGPYGNVVFDADGNLYGTASNHAFGGECQGNCGVIWKITP